MRGKRIAYSVIILLLLALFLPGILAGPICAGQAVAKPASWQDQTGTLVPEAQETGAQAGSEQSATPEPEETKPPEEQLLEAVASRTPIPTPLPGFIDEAASEIAQATGLASRTLLGLAAEDWLTMLFTALAALAVYLLGNWLIRNLLRRLVERTPIEFDDALLKAVSSQLRWLLVILVLQFTIARSSLIGARFRILLNDLFFIVYLIIGFSIAWKLLDVAVNWYRNRLATQEERERLAPVIILLHRMAQAVLIAIGITIILAHFGVNVTAFTTSLGLAGLALSLAAQDTLADAISGIIILVDRPFRVGDRIEISGLGTWGDVMEIGVRTTRIRTRDNRMVIVPNSVIGKSQVVNYTYPDPRYRVETEIGIGYGTDIERARRIIVETVEKVDGVLPDKPVDALYILMGDSAMIFRVRWWIESYIDTRRVFDRVHTALQGALDTAGIDMPFPTQTLKIQIDQQMAERVGRGLQEST